MGCTPSAPEGSGKEIGGLQFGGSGLCWARHPYKFNLNGCCGPKAPTTSAQWDAAYKGLETILDEVDAEVGAPGNSG
jgi:hypothetical protein